MLRTAYISFLKIKIKQKAMIFFFITHGEIWRNKIIVKNAVCIRILSEKK